MENQHLLIITMKKLILKLHKVHLKAELQQTNSTVMALQLIQINILYKVMNKIASNIQFMVHGNRVINFLFGLTSMTIKKKIISVV